MLYNSRLQYLHAAEEVPAHDAAVPLGGLAHYDRSIGLVVGNDETPPFVLRNVGPGECADIRSYPPPRNNK